MKTSELIELLRKADPTGELPVVNEIGIVQNVSLVDASKDYPFSFLDSNGVMVFSSRGFKIELNSIDTWTYIEKNYSKGMSWEELLKKFKFEIFYDSPEEIKNRITSILNKIKEEYNTIVEIHKTAETNIESTDTTLRKKKVGLVSNRFKKL